MIFCQNVSFFGLRLSEERRERLLSEALREEVLEFEELLDPPRRERRRPPREDLRGFSVV